jgi:DNA-binding Lrp family transcriptional regulator
METTVGRSTKVAAAVKQLTGVKSVDIVTGPYDVIAVIEAGTLSDIGDIVTGKIHPITGISRTVTLLSLESS